MHAQEYWRGKRMRWIDAAGGTAIVANPLAVPATALL